MHVERTLLVLPVHRRTSADYYAEHDRFVEEQKPEVEREWGCSFDELPAHIRLRWKDRWYWPPWLFNDVVGFLKIGLTADQGLGADVYLKRRHFPLTAPERLYRGRERTRERDQILHFWSLARRSVEPGRNDTYVEAARDLIAEAEATVQRYGRATENATVWEPELDLSFVDFAAAHRELREKGRPAGTGDALPGTDTPTY